MKNTNKVKAITPRTAWQMLQIESNAILVDIRSSMEFLFVGHPDGAVHIPWVDEPDWEVNPHFVSEIERHIEKKQTHSQYAKVILICRSGDRSIKAAKRLLNSGLNNIFHVYEGFEGDLDENEQRSSVNGWRLSGLPWRQG